MKNKCSHSIKVFVCIFEVTTNNSLDKNTENGPISLEIDTIKVKKKVSKKQQQREKISSVVQ